MADGPLSAVLAEIRAQLEAAAGGIDPARASSAAGTLHGNALKALAAVEAVLKPHAPRTDRVLGSSCFTHRTTLNTTFPLPGCRNCVQDRKREVCPECRDEYGDPVLFQDCRARSAALAGLTGRGTDDDQPSTR